LFDQAWLPRLGWTTLEEERLNAVFPYLDGRVLDIGAGPNTLIKRYQNGIGVDVYDWGGGALVVENTATLPFPDASFETITFIACLNHIPNRQEVLYEARRLIKPYGRLIITMINPILGGIGHAIWWYSEDKQRGGMKEGEVGGLWTHDIVQMCHEAGFTLQLHKRFLLGMNNLYLFVPRLSDSISS
ncbi:MAG: methyltransferase domain-containing protein, partial [Candidatus Hadarchaeum sp.]